MARLSKAELIIVNHLKEKGILCEPSYTPDSKTKFEFDLGFKFQNRLFLIEYNSKQFYSEKNIYRSKIEKAKNRFCEKHGYPLLIINYDIPLPEMKIMIDKFIENNSKVKIL